ncbi:hypothetical protein AGRA3207_003532 [Actinomadura graeca]|uniref:AbrB/MazE/SpoVT family DNA-binding domain-containing protein n=1 Tax=Actinomadura graeca TaxID=2750812 RepID=A0ABX8QUV5_9ACTN|nr:hypothetical protein [Actinomadura graeca]QXJ22517.1 hypothetical protein AGRA3207_003532 [Actinomadura graeca]
MTRPAKPSAPVTRMTAELRRGNAIYIRGIGTVPVVGVLPLPRGQALIVLARDDLAVISTPAAEWEALCADAPVEFLARVTFCSTCRGVGRTCRL